jgi:hypothetical protein
MKKSLVVSSLVLFFAPLVVAQPRGAAGMQGRGAGAAWCGRNGNGVCNGTGRSAGQRGGTGAGMCARGAGMRAGQGMAGRGAWGRGMGRGFQQAEPQQQPPAQKN